MKKTIKIQTSFEEYEILNIIGEGGSGTVYSVVASDGKKFAVKILDYQRATRDKIKRFENECRFCMEEHHPNIIQVLDHGITESKDPFFVMPLYNYSLRKLIGRLKIENAMEIFKKVLDGVDAAHKLGVVHRDIKPENILIGNNEKSVVVADFGIAHFRQEDLYTAVETKEGARLANFQYASPEQRVKGRNVRETADIYALGLILNELFTSELAHGTNFKTIKSVSSQYSYLDLLIDKMLAQDPSSRFQTIDELKRELIVRGSEAVSLLKLDSLRNKVIDISEPNDQIINNPMKIVNVDWENGKLTIVLNNAINSNWVWAMQNMGSYSSVMGKAPANFQYTGNQATIPVSSESVQSVINCFKEWLPQANQAYITKVRRDREKIEQKEREELQRKIKAEEERVNLLKNLKF